MPPFALARDGTMDVMSKSIDAKKASRADASSITLFCFPYSGGSAASYTSFQSGLACGAVVHAFQLPGRGSRLFETSYGDMETLVAALVAEILATGAKRFAFFGHSLGAVVAFEVARALRHMRATMPLALFASGAESPRMRKVKRRMHDLSNADFKKHLADYGGTPQAVLACDELMDILIPGIRADFTISEQYIWREEALLDLPIDVLVGNGDAFVEWERACGWSAETTGDVRYHVLDGQHFFIETDQQRVLDILRSALQALISESIELD